MGTKTGLTASQADHLLSASKGAEAALYHLAALFEVLVNETVHNTSSTVHELARLGQFHATDQANVTDSMIESLERGEVK